MLETVVVAMIVATVVAIIFTVIYLLHYIGYFYKVKVHTGRSIVSQIKVAYKFHEGASTGCYQLLLEGCYLCPEMRTFVIRYDDPFKADGRFAVGIILAEGQEEFDDSNLKMKLEEYKYQFADFPNVDYSVKSSHPYATSFSPSLAEKKAYPSLVTYIEKEKLCAHPYMEIYMTDTIHYMVPLSKQSDFYVDEAK